MICCRLDILKPAPLASRLLSAKPSKRYRFVRVGPGAMVGQRFRVEWVEVSFLETFSTHMGVGVRQITINEMFLKHSHEGNYLSQCVTCPAGGFA